MTEPVVTPTPEAAPPVAPAGPPATDKGFPEGTPLAEMSDAQKAAYWQQQAQRWESRRKTDLSDAYEGLTPQQVKDLRAKNEELEAKTQTADEKALKQATKQASDAARAEATAQYLPQIQRLEVKSIAGSVISGDKLNAFMEIVNPAALVGEDGTVDETKVMGYLTAMYGDTATAPQPGPRHQNFGQFAPPPPRSNPGSAGAAEAAKRFGTKTT